jgi:hypothetical protein
MLSASGYFEYLRKEETLKYSITLKGWQFMEYYENNLANKRLMDIQIKDYEYQRKVTRISIRITIVSVIIAALSFIYTLYNTHTSSIKNGILMKENRILRDSITPYKVIQCSNDTAQCERHTTKKK